jgi:hypothetical protein
VTVGYRLSIQAGPSRLAYFDIGFIYSNKNFFLVPASKLGRLANIGGVPLRRLPSEEGEADKKAPASGRFLGPAKGAVGAFGGDSFATFSSAPFSLF